MRIEDNIKDKFILKNLQLMVISCVCLCLCVVEDWNFMQIRTYSFQGSLVLARVHCVLACVSKPAYVCF